MAATSGGLHPNVTNEIVVYWRPGCGFCSMLLRGLDRAEVTYRMVNIWDDPEAAAFVRSVARGNETVPTVAVGEIAMVNPSVKDVLAAAGS
ncbi:MAG: glutaredoxin domain-containing protein [Acidimicrobiia bacterium]